jgi:hypothetical protein
MVVGMVGGVVGTVVGTVVGRVVERTVASMVVDTEGGMVAGMAAGITLASASSAILHSVVLVGMAMQAASASQVLGKLRLLSTPTSPFVTTHPHTHLFSCSHVCCSGWC